MSRSQPAFINDGPVPSPDSPPSSQRSWIQWGQGIFRRQPPAGRQVPNVESSERYWVGIVLNTADLHWRIKTFNTERRRGTMSSKFSTVTLRYWLTAAAGGGNFWAPTLSPRSLFGSYTRIRKKFAKRYSGVARFHGLLHVYLHACANFFPRMFGVIARMQVAGRLCSSLFSFSCNVRQ